MVHVIVTRRPYQGKHVCHIQIIWKLQLHSASGRLMRDVVLVNNDNYNDLGLFVIDEVTMN